jgi:hypothetical protein
MSLKYTVWFDYRHGKLPEREGVMKRFESGFSQDQQAVSRQRCWRFFIGWFPLLDAKAACATRFV